MIGFNEFPTLHPLVIHFPIALLIIVVFFQIFAILMKKKLLDIIVMFLLIGGFTGALVASIILHPHVEGLDVKTLQILRDHEFYAYLTIWISGISLLLKSANIYIFKRLFWIELIITVLIIGSSITVSMAGHYGARLVYVEGVGPQGNYLE